MADSFKQQSLSTSTNLVFWKLAAKIPPDLPFQREENPDKREISPLKKGDKGGFNSVSKSYSVTNLAIIWLL